MGMWVAARKIETPRMTLYPGEPLPPKYNTLYSRRYLKRTLGEDCIFELDYRNPDKFLSVVGKVGDENLKGQFMQLKLVAEEQARTIKNLERENAQLKKQLERQKP